MTLRALVKRSIALTCAYYLSDDWRARRRLAAGKLSTRSGARHRGFDLDQSLAYVEKVHRDYLAYAGVTRFRGTVAEIGPGDNFGVALLLRAGGARHVHAVDRYRPERDPERQRAIYEALAERHGLFHLFDGEPAEETITGLHYRLGTPAEWFFRESGLRFDAVLSRAVLEHLYDPRAALDDMVRALNPGGVLVHRIDLRDHGMFAGHHPLTFLTIPERIYARMTRGAGRPNRVLLPSYRRWLAASGAEGSLRITRLAGVPDEVGPAEWEELDPGSRAQALETVAAIRRKLARPFRDLADEDLAVAGCVLVARRPG
jgi:SAM-dependent methyltransferase